MSAPPLDLPRCEALLERACAGDAAAYRDLTAELWPFWHHLVRTSRAMGPLSRSEDHIRDVLTTLVEKISPEGGTALGLYPAWRAQNEGKTFEDWIRIVTAFTVRDFVRKSLGRSRLKDPDVPSPKRLLNEFVTSPVADDPRLSTRPAFTAAQTARQLVEWAEGRLPQEQMRALILWMEGAELDEIGDELTNGDTEAGKKLVRAAVAVLRRQFAGSG